MDALNKYLLMYRSTPHSTTGKPPAELLFDWNIRDKLPSIRQPLEIGNDKYEEVQEDQDKMRKEKGKEYIDRKRHAEKSALKIGDTVVIKNFAKRNKMETNFEDVNYKIRRNVAHTLLVPQEETLPRDDGQSGENSEQIPEAVIDSLPVEEPKKRTKKPLPPPREVHPRAVKPPKRYDV